MRSITETCLTKSYCTQRVAPVRQVDPNMLDVPQQRGNYYPGHYGRTSKQEAYNMNGTKYIYTKHEDIQDSYRNIITLQCNE